MLDTGERGVFALVAVNVVLQMLDGIGTYWGMLAGFAEGNPLVAWCMAEFGTAPALLTAKIGALVCIAVVWALRQSRIAVPALAFTAAVYAACAVGPWAVALASDQSRVW